MLPFFYVVVLSYGHIGKYQEGEKEDERGPREEKQKFFQWSLSSCFDTVAARTAQGYSVCRLSHISIVHTCVAVTLVKRRLNRHVSSSAGVHALPPSLFPPIFAYPVQPLFSGEQDRRRTEEHWGKK